MNREDYLDSIAYWNKTMYHAETIVETKEYPEWRTQCLNKPYYHNPNPKVLGKVMAVDYTSAKDHSSACVYINLNPEGREWIDELKKSIELNERRQRMRFNSHYGMYPKPYLYFKNGEECKMSKAENDGRTGCC